MTICSCPWRRPRRRSPPVANTRHHSSSARCAPHPEPRSTTEPRCRDSQAAELLSFVAVTVANLSYSGFYCTPDLEHNAELRITFHCSPTPNACYAEVLQDFRGVRIKLL